MIHATLAPRDAARLLYHAALRAGTLRTLFDEDQPRDERGQWTSTGSSVTHTHEAVGFQENPWKFQKFKGAPDLRRNIVSVKQANDYKRELKRQGRLNDDGTVSLYHATVSDPSEILERGLVPGAKAAPGQDWKAEHSSYATYFHLDRSVAERDIEYGGHVIEARIPVTPKNLIRFLPDEDSSSDPAEGVNILVRGGGAVAFIGGVPPSALRNIASSDGTSVRRIRHNEFNEDQPRDELGRWTDTGVGPGRTVSDAELRRQAVAASAAGLVHSLYSDTPAKVTVTPSMTPEDRIAVVEAGLGAYKGIYVREDQYDYKAGGAKRYSEFEAEAKKAGWSHQEILDKGIERGLISLKKDETFTRGIASTSTFRTEDILGGLDEGGRSAIEEAILRRPAMEWSPDIEDLHKAGWTTPELERFADRVQAAGGKHENWGEGKYRGADALAGTLAFYTNDYDSFRSEVYQGWAIASNTATSRTVRAVAEDAFPLPDGALFYRPPMTEFERSIRGAYNPATSYSPRAVANMRALKAETEAFYTKKFKGADLSTKPLEVMRGIGGHPEAYTPGSAESWTTDKRTAVRFGRLMASNNERFSTLTTQVTYADVLWSYQTAAGKPGWPEEKDLKGKKEFVILGSRVRDVGVTHDDH